ncbi:MAG: TIGR01906 family membrane protein [Clostridiales bacterium]|jgi:integral membrane protein (TIGR01906 family)|nr:TIGR01906 family membrane protein [Clostridiales bacterium]
MKRNKPRFKPTDLIIGVIFTFLIVSLGVIFTVNFKPLYYFDIDYLNISENSGYDKELIKRNYDALIDYNSPFYKGQLEFPDLASSANGLQHFVEVKDIFTSFYYIGLITIIICLLIIIYKKKKRDNSYLLVSSITVVVLPILVALFSAIDFDKTFVIFHKIFFRNDYWIFDPKLDPVIKILPQTFFLHALILIILFLLLGSMTLFIAYRISKRK